MTQLITVLGSTGSIGSSTLDVVELHPDKFQVFALTAARNVEILCRQIQKWKPRYAVLIDPDAYELLSKQLPSGICTELLFGEEALAFVASHPDVDQVMAAIVGAAGLAPTIAAANVGKRVLLANKESLVMAGPLFMEAVSQGGATLLPIDSEHNAIFQSMPSNHTGDWKTHGIEKILLTASGGPFRGWNRNQLVNVTPSQAVAHPNWSMGQKISVDSATLMNKGLELIEACFLFDCRADQVQVVVHPQSVIHSMVQYIDGSVIAQLGQPDMKTPIAYGMAWPDRIEAGVKNLDLFEISQLDFQTPDEKTFPALALAREAVEQGGCKPAVLNAANEIAVHAFLSERISFLTIPELVESVMNKATNQPALSLQEVLEADAWAREVALDLIG